MYSLVIDIGNTLSKIALFNNRDIIKTESFSVLTPQHAEDFTAGYKADNAILSSVKFDAQEIEEYLQKKYKFLRFNTSVSTGIVSHYKTQATLGLDRYAAIIGAVSLFPNQNCLVIDAGSCITCDFISRDKNYYGGSISPGLNMRYKAMHTFTGKLPLLEFDPNHSTDFGDDTRTSMITGVQNGILYEVKGFIQSYLSRYPDLVVALCGGDGFFFDTQLKNSIFARIVKTVPNLVLIGLNEVIHQHND